MSSPDSGGQPSPARARRWIRREIDRLDPLADSERVYRLSVMRLLPNHPRAGALMAETLYAVSFLRVTAPPAAARPVHRDGRGAVYSDPDRRARETNQHIFIWALLGPSSEAAKRSLAQVRSMHDAIAQNWDMPLHTYLYGTAWFTVQFDRTMRLTGAPGLSRNEKIASVAVWRSIAEQLGVDPSQLPATWEGMTGLLEDYEADPTFFAYSPEAAHVAEQLIDGFATRWAPRRWRRAGRWIVLSLTEPHVIDTLRLPSPPPLAVRRLVHVAVRAGLLIRRAFIADPPDRESALAITGWLDHQTT